MQGFSFNLYGKQCLVPNAFEVYSLVLNKNDFHFSTLTNLPAQDYGLTPAPQSL